MAMVTRPALLVCLLAVISSAAANAAPRVIADAGKTAYAIRLCSQPTPAEETAAQELQRFLKEISGAQLPIRQGGAIPARALLVGRDAAVEALLPGTDWASLGGEGFIVRTTGPHLVLAGGRPRGTLYAVYSFLDKELGCRWFAPDCSRIPKQPRLAVSDLNRRWTFRLEYREPFAFTAFDGDWAARNFANGYSAKLLEKHGGHITYQGFVHTFYTLLPPDKYFAEHPEWYSERNGKRVHDGGQLCLTNPEVVRQVTEAVRAELRRNPSANIISVSQNDCQGWCECAQCKAVDDEEGSHSGTLLRFVNQVAEEIEKEFPNVAIDTLAYQYTRKPPLHVRPRPNVIVRLCSIECCFTHPLETCPQNASFRDDIVGWSKICNRLYIWDYVTNFAHYLLPHPNLDVLEPNIRFFAAHGVKGVFEEGNYTSPGGEMMELRDYMMARLLADPDYGAKRARKEFLEGYYGPAAAPIRDYLSLTHDKVRKEKIHLGCYVQPTSAHLSPEIIARAETLFDAAERLAAGRPEILKRVHTARLPVDYVALLRGRTWSREAERQGKNIGPFGPGWSEKETSDRFFADAAEAGVIQISEGGPFDRFRERMQGQGMVRRVRPTPPPGTENTARERVIDAQDDEFSFYREGELCGVRADESASDGACAWITGATREWAIQYPLPMQYFKPDHKYRAFVVIKTRKTGDSGDAFTFGLYETQSRGYWGNHTVTAAEAPTEWKTYEVGAFTPKGKPYVWVSGCANGAAVTDILVDRIYFVEEQ